MINLNEQKDYFILVDGKGSVFGGGRIFEGIEEVVEQFQEWAEADEYEDEKLIGWTIGDCIDNWIFELKQYDGRDFIEVGDKILEYKIK